MKSKLLVLLLATGICVASCSSSRETSTSSDSTMMDGSDTMNMTDTTGNGGTMTDTMTTTPGTSDTSTTGTTPMP